MNRMVRKLLTLNHLEFGQDALTEEPFDICEMLTTLLNSSALEMQKKEIKVIKQYPASCMVIGDEFKIEEVCTNYISNAMNHVNGDMRICVTLEEQDDTVKITVANTGDPIPEDSLDKVWIKFYKVDKARTREYGGSGIGLSIVKAIMDAHKQPFGVYNTAEGVAFWFCLKKRQKKKQMYRRMRMTQEVWNKIINSEMLLIGIGTQLSVKEDNEKQIDEVYDTLAKLAKGRNCFVITSNTDQKLLDGRISKFLTAAPKVEGQEKQWEAYMNWLSCSLTHELTILELGEGFADPMVMRWPFEKVLSMHQKATLIRVHPMLYQVPADLNGRGIGVKEDCIQFVKEIAEQLSHE